MTEVAQPPIARLLARPRFVLVGGLVAVVAVSWGYLFWMAHDMSSMAARMGPMGDMPAHGMGVLWILGMWVVMASAMMLPTAAPMVVMHARFQSGRAPDTDPTPFTSLFAGGYLAAWTAFGVVATALQVGLEAIALMHPMAMKLTTGPVAASVLLVAGVFQLSAAKGACLTRCRTPLGFFMTEWREGLGGAFSMGFRHGLFCVGCCWALMAVLFVVGTMNLLWMGVLTLVMLLEKVVPRGHLLSRALGVALVAAAIAVFVH